MGEKKSTRPEKDFFLAIVTSYSWSVQRHQLRSQNTANIPKSDNESRSHCRSVLVPKETKEEGNRERNNKQSGRNRQNGCTPEQESNDWRNQSPDKRSSEE
jgi:hypothetical protein